MYTVGIDCEIILDFQGYWVKPGSYRMKQPRIRKATVRADNGESYVDLGPGKRIWSMVILCKNDLTNYDGGATNITGQQYRDALRTSYNKVATTLSYQDPVSASTAIQVHFDGYAEMITDLHSQQVPLSTGQAAGVSYEVAIELTEV